MTAVLMKRWLIIVLAVAAPASAQVYGLSPAAKSAAIEAASQRPDADNPALLPALTQDHRPHGEIGVMIGTGGARGIYGAIGVPLGDSGSAALSFSQDRSPRFYGDGPFDVARQSFGMRLRRQGW